MTIPIEIADFLCRKRLRKHGRRLARGIRKNLLSHAKKQERLSRFGPRSQIIERLAAAYAPDVPALERTLVVQIPRVFSIIEDPVAAIRVVQRFAKAFRANGIKVIEIDQSNVETYDLAANALLDIVASEADTESKNRDRALHFTGKYPKDPAVKRFIRSMGVVKHLKIQHEIAKGEETSKIRLFDKRNRHYYAKQNPEKSDAKARAVTGFVDHFNQCLRDHHRALTPEARSKLCDYIGEILGNAEDHAGFVDWTVQGYLDNSLEVPICEIAIFNFGKSIAETLKELPPDHYTRKRQVDPYIILQNGRRFFGKTWSQSDLMTLIALQGHVSSKNTTDKDTRGQGTGDLIDFFQRVHKECAEHSPVKAKMAIVSGGTYILFDGTYKMREDEKRGRVIAFNVQNDLYSPPDPRFVKSLGSVHFPGTVISIRFPLSATSTVPLGKN